ncbi:hypothetical protein [Nocardia puris]|uniref:hypothetical protein n=1 Tax=Nocardia puris TaxID=208602 RepID=UPI0018943E71|nr:hypothetical protein [Nocardia puris]
MRGSAVPAAADQRGGGGKGKASGGMVGITIGGRPGTTKVFGPGVGGGCGGDEQGGQRRTGDGGGADGTGRAHR